jgi:hypothetical protein
VVDVATDCIAAVGRIHIPRMSVIHERKHVARTTASPQTRTNSRACARIATHDRAGGNCARRNKPPAPCVIVIGNAQAGTTHTQRIVEGTPRGNAPAYSSCPRLQCRFGVGHKPWRDLQIKL